MKQTKLFSEKRITNIIGCLYDELGTDTVPCRKLMKLLYLCDRNMYNVHEVFITNDTYNSMHNGPVLSTTDNLIQLSADKSLDFYFKKHFVKKGDEVIRQKYSPLSDEHQEKKDELTEEGKYIIESVACIFGDDTEKEIISFTHTACDEWKDPEEFGMAIIPITEQDIRNALGKDD